MNIKYWLYAIRLYTLFLSFSGITLSFLIAKSQGKEDYIIYILSLITALLLQILANLSNDYGDSVKEVDNTKRIGPLRMVQSGYISKYKMKKVIKIFSFLSFFFGIILLLKSFDLKNNIYFFLFYFFGILICIYSSINYTIGFYPYGYLGFGDLLVFIFFGIISVEGSYFLYTHIFSLDVFILSLSIGLLNISVLNINNMRDIESDFKNRKYTIAGILGIKNAKLYHFCTILVSIFLGIKFIILNYHNIYQFFLFILNIPFFIQHLNEIFFQKKIKNFNFLLKKLIFIIFLYSMSIGFGCIL
ncbi:1,4-dihydroxy-2-naphthoate octaprenyltransferase [Blattabacterium cuenoti]|uniref:1,4-dihydroxy-2-naphthoate octaprenyltransferase n=1 Tax=Blattabacterium cuenoti TaxID=1653831 RepID=UPI00163B784F|nr:1,4-dihydroxy-2-naphthoate octaprenyltransferase [Blattabacterium cuenoti]